ncbi:hypothetical protein BT96DRAFT_1082683 [Gymnopus androsaceus JB14]|uniref:Uncharacterized protein n=1 Tax=Gymnopus androsaceus JB14 TaxID=1447944 RepID=A0A6A4GNH9_9AGAR|nr:hypothetical protein BT96DRAFT_1082683 [Gymnopus androsaceus JB14]
MKQLGVQALSHFFIPPRVLGGTPCTSSQPSQGKDQRMKEALCAEQEPESEEDCPRQWKQKCGNCSKGKEKAGTISDPEDLAYLGSDGDTELDSDVNASISHEELADSLPSKTVPEGTTCNGKSTWEKRTQKKQKKDTEESATVESNGNEPVKKPTLQQELSIMMEINTTAAVTVNVFEQSKPSAEQIQVAEGKKVFADSSELLRYLDSISSSVERQHTLREALTHAAENKLREWDQKTFEKLLIEWIIPSADTVQRHIMNKGQEMEKDLQDFFKALECKVSISLDAWTSLNGYAFIALIAHYITNDAYGAQTSGPPPLPSPPLLRSGGPPGREVVSGHSKASFALILIGGNPLPNPNP